MDAQAALPRLERIVDLSRVAPRIEALLPSGPRPRQLRVRTLLLGMLLAARDGRPAHLKRVHAALLRLPEADQRRLGVIAQWRDGPHGLTYRQVERTFSLMVKVLQKEKPDGTPAAVLSDVLDALIEASIEAVGKPASSSYAVDWTDLETWSRPRPKRGGDCADPEASWGHRRGNSPGEEDEPFLGYYLQVATVVPDEHGPDVPELVRRIQIASCDTDPPGALVPVLERMAAGGIEISDLLADSGYSYRKPETWALPLRRLGASLVQELHPNDRGPNGTHMGAIHSNGNLYCPGTPRALLELSPLRPGAEPEQQAAHDRKTEELAGYKLSRITGDDPDGYHRVACPAAQKAPLPAPTRLDRARPRPPRGALPAAAPTDLLSPADDHGAGVGQRQDRPEARLPLQGAPALLRPPLGRRARLRQRQGSRQQRPLTRLVPAHGARPDRALRRQRVRRPQPSRRRRLRRPPGREPAAGRERAPTQTAQTPPADRRRPHRRRQRTALTAPSLPPRAQPEQRPACGRNSPHARPHRPRPGTAPQRGRSQPGRPPRKHRKQPHRHPRCHPAQT
jgi:hypothetical protein